MTHTEPAHAWTWNFKIILYTVIKTTISEIEQLFITYVQEAKKKHIPILQLYFGRRNMYNEKKNMQHYNYRILSNDGGRE